MQKYQSDFLKSRKLTEYDFIPCEVCWAEAKDIHHIQCSYRWMKAHNPDGSDLIALCRNCHAYIHAHNTPVMRESLMAIVAYRLITLNE